MVELPTGTVTFLFTDIEGSTRLLKHLRSRYGTVLERQQQILRDAFAAHGGHEIDTQGDSFFVAFRRASDAVAAAVAGQRALAAEAWPDGAAVRVRMGLHTGEAMLAGGRYVGVAVHRAARIGAAGHGGQILMSQITHDLLHDEEADLDEVRIVGLGEYRLKDLDRPVRLYQVAALGLETHFPPVRTGPPGEPAAAAVGADAGGARVRRGPSRRVAGVGAAVAALAVAVTAVAVADRGGDPPAVVAGSLVELDPETGDVRAVHTLGSAHAGEAIVSDGVVWVAKEADGTLWRLDERRGRATPLGLAARGAAAAGDGGLWIPLRRPTRIGYLSAEALRVQRSVRVRAPLVEPVAFGGGYLWAVVPAPGEARDGDVGPEWRGVALRIHPRSGRVVSRARVGLTAWWAAYGSDALWVTNYRDDRLVRVDALSEAVDSREMPFGPDRVVTAPGAVWVGHFSARTILRIDPVSLDTEDVIELPEPAPDFAVGAGSVWVAQPGRKELRRFDVRDGSLLQTLPLPHAPWSVELGADSLWVVVGRGE